MASKNKTGSLQFGLPGKAGRGQRAMHKFAYQPLHFVPLKAPVSSHHLSLVFLTRAHWPRQDPSPQPRDELCSGRDRQGGKLVVRRPGGGGSV